MITSEPLVGVVQVLPRSFWDDPALRPMPPFEGAELVLEAISPQDPRLGDLNPEVMGQLVFVHQVVDDAFGKVERLFVFRLHPRPD